MNTGKIDPIARTFDLGLYDETNSSLLVNNFVVSWSYRDE